MSLRAMGENMGKALKEDARIGVAMVKGKGRSKVETPPDKPATRRSPSKRVTPVNPEITNPAKAKEDWNALFYGPYTIDRIHLAESIGPLYQYHGRAISIVEPGSNGSQYVEWHPTEHTIDGDPDEHQRLDIMTPADLYDVQDWLIVHFVYNFSSELYEKIRAGLMFGLVVVLFFFLYLIWSD